MSYTEQDVERAAPRVWAEDYFFCHGAYPDEADPPVRWEDVPEAIRVHARAISRAALAAMEREPLEDVLGDALVIAHTVMPANGLGTRIVVSVKQAGRNYRYGTGDTIDEAIRNAAAAAKGDE